jgi:hypothetical protein
MKIDDLRKRLRKDRPMTSVTLRMPGDVVEELKKIAPLLGFSGYQPLMRAYIGHGLRQDVDRLERLPSVDRVVKSLRSHGVAENVIRLTVEDLQADLTKRLG